MVGPHEQADEEYEVADTYTTDGDDTVVIYDTHGDQHIIIKED